MNVNMLLDYYKKEEQFEDILKNKININKSDKNISIFIRNRYCSNTTY